MATVATTSRELQGPRGQARQQAAENLRVARSATCAKWTRKTLDKAVKWARAAAVEAAAESESDAAAAAAAAAPANEAQNHVKELLRAVCLSAYASRDVRDACVELDPACAAWARERDEAENALPELARLWAELGWDVAEAARRLVLFEAERRRHEHEHEHERVVEVPRGDRSSIATTPTAAPSGFAGVHEHGTSRAEPHHV